MKGQVEVVGAIIINNQGEVLCALRGAKMSLPGYWEFPGGKPKIGESLEEALIREIHEELNCHITVHQLFEDTSIDLHGMRIRLITYISSISAGSPEALEHEKIIWCPIIEISGLKWAPADVPAVKKLLGKSNKWI